ncbi:MAG: GNAT family N-acetyltransferase [Actinomycetota bacterium]|nr:GNAT family N-acetyltransferase [Actinomycetota bacterium]MDQ3716144.1 GNAT family N-acetyltransferase [Actinomycetota bacterium]
MTTVQRVDPRSDPRWHDLVAGPGGSLFTSPPWITAVCDSYGFIPEAAVLIDPAGAPRGGVAWTDVEDLRGGRRLALPFCDRADPVAADLTAWQAMSADTFPGDLPFTLRCLDTSPAVADPRWTAVHEAAWHTTALSRPLDDLHAALRPQTRRNIATAERTGVEVILSGESEAVREYHRLHVELRRRKYRMLAQPWDFFDRIWKAFAPTDAIRTALATVDGRPVAGALYLVWQDTVYYKFGASMAEALHHRPNDAVHWAVMQWAHGRGLRTLDWGLSDLDQPGLCRYKRGWASVEGRIHKLTAGGPLRGRRADVEETLTALTDLLTDPTVPSAVTERAGALLYRYFC